MKEKELATECKQIIRCIFEGLTTKETAQRLNYSKSTVSLRMRYIFDKYNAKNKIEFVILVFSELLNKNKKKIKELKAENAILKTKK